MRWREGKDDSLRERRTTHHVKEALQFIVHVELREAGVGIEANVRDVFEVHWHPYLILAVGREWDIKNISGGYQRVRQQCGNKKKWSREKEPWF